MASFQYSQTLDLWWKTTSIFVAQGASEYLVRTSRRTLCQGSCEGGAHMLGLRKAGLQGWNARSLCPVGVFVEDVVATHGAIWRILPKSIVDSNSAKCFSQLSYFLPAENIVLPSACMTSVGVVLVLSKSLPVPKRSLSHSLPKKEINYQ